MRAQIPLLISLRKSCIFDLLQFPRSFLRVLARPLALLPISPPARYSTRSSSESPVYALHLINSDLVRCPRSFVSYSHALL